MDMFVSTDKQNIYTLPSVHPSSVLPAQGHAGVFGRLSAGEDLVITHYGHLILRVKDLQSTDLQGEKEPRHAKVSS